jgi:acylphosphatase
MSGAQSIRHVIVRGLVQRVGFRAWTEYMALEQGLEGWVRNRRDETVEAVFAGPSDKVAAMIKACHIGPRGARVTAVEEREGSPEDLALRHPDAGFSVLPTA